MTKTTAKRKKRKKEKSVVIKAILVLFSVLILLTLSKTTKRFLTKNDSLAPSKKPEQVERVEISGVFVKDFFEDNAHQKPHITLSRTKDYHIFYIPDQEVFFISIVSYPFDDHRIFAEEDFLDKLGITEKEACKLNVNITTPSFANPDKAGTTYGLSFCSGKT